MTDGIAKPVVRKPPAAGSGRKLGARNKVTMAMREMVLLVNQDIGGREAMGEWAKKHRTEFYKILARLIPTEIHAQVDTRIVDENRIREIRDSLREASETRTVQ